MLQGVNLGVNSTWCQQGVADGCLRRDWGTVPLSCSKMAAAERRKARRRKLLQNSEERLQKILGTRSSHPIASKTEIEPSESVLRSASTEKVDGSNENDPAVDPVESETIVGENDVSSVAEDLVDQNLKRSTTETPVCETQDVETDKTNYLDNEFKDIPETTSHREGSQRSNVDKTTEQVSPSSKSRNWTRVIFNVILAIALVSKWTYVNLGVLLSTNEKPGPNNPERVLLQSEVSQWLQVVK